MTRSGCVYVSVINAVSPPDAPAGFSLMAGAVSEDPAAPLVPVSGAVLRRLSAKR